MDLAIEKINLPVLSSFINKIDLFTSSKPYSEHCQIEANNDLEAVNSWLTQHNDNKHTYLSYSREAKRLLLWCVYEKGITFAKLKISDFEEYFSFLQNPPDEWCAHIAELKVTKKSEAWRPFIGPLNNMSFNMAVRVINSLMNFLVEADYLRSNPIKLIKKHRKFSFDLEEQKYRIKSRMLEDDEWQAVQDTLNNMPESNKNEVDNKIRTQFLFALLYLLGLRIHEVEKSSWNAFREMDGNWWFFIKGKGGKLGHIPVNEQMLSFMKIYRLHLGKTPLPSIDEYEQLLISKRTGEPLKQDQIYKLVKAIGKEAAKQFKDDHRKKNKLEQLSPHWLRHLSASHQDKLGIPATVIQANHRHSSYQTTQLYLHAEDKLREKEMQKMSMAVRANIVEPKEEIKITELIITLSGNSINEVSGLERLLNSIEGNVFKGISWHALHSREELLLRYKNQYRYRRELPIKYKLKNVEETEIKYINQAIEREADIRLFGCNIQIRNVD